jgi:hypothetical protein
MKRTTWISRFEQRLAFFEDIAGGIEGPWKADFERRARRCQRKKF